MLMEADGGKILFSRCNNTSVTLAHSHGLAIDSLEDEKYKIYRQGGKLGLATRGLKNLVRMKKELGSETQINLRMIVMKQNEHEVDRMRDFAREIGAESYTA